MNRKFASLFVAAGLMFSTQCFGHQIDAKPIQPAYKIVSADKIFITEKGIFFQDIDGIAQEVRGLIQTSEGLRAYIDRMQPEYCSLCGRLARGEDATGRSLCSNMECPNFMRGI